MLLQEMIRLGCAGNTNASFIDSGGFFRRSRFGGGLVLRPDIRALSPVIK
jgi:hypothetical protein